MTVNQLIEFCKENNLSLDTDIIVDVVDRYGGAYQESSGVDGIIEFNNEKAIKLY